MDDFLEKDEIPDLTWRRCRSLKRPITRDKIEKVNKDVPFRQTPRPEGFSAKFYLTFKEKFIPVILTISSYRERQTSSQFIF